MDPTTTLITFMLQTHPSVKSVHLVGSWDNFSKPYVMERDIRRARGQWRGCYSFKDIVCDDDFGRVHKRNGGLKMGHTYYYYYELDGSYETHDPALPSTTACPYLPGQTVNSLFVPVERALRKRSASLSSMRIADFKTMNPDDKFITPRAPPPVPCTPSHMRTGSSPLVLNQKNSSRSVSPPPPWKRLFGLKSALGREDRGRRQDADAQSESSNMDDSRSLASSDGSRTRDISPESLRRFLSDDGPVSRPAATDDKPAIVIPEDIAEEMEDDENFATSATSENSPYTTCLSPPPFKRTHSSSSLAPSTTNASSMTLTHLAEEEQLAVDSSSRERVEIPAVAPTLDGIDFSFPRSRFSISTAGSLEDFTPSPNSLDDEIPSFYDSNDDDDVLSSNDGDTLSFQPMSFPSTRKQSLEQNTTPFAGYSLPQATSDGKTLNAPPNYGPLGSPALVARNDAGMPVGNTSLLAAPVDTALDDLVSELGWMVDVIHGKSN